MKRRAEEIYTSYKKSLSEDYSLSSLAPCLEKTSRFKGRKEVRDKLPLMTEIASKSEVWGMVLAVPALASLLYLVLPLCTFQKFCHSIPRFCHKIPANLSKSRFV